MKSIQDTAYTLRDEGPRRLSPYSSAMFMSNGGAGMTSIDLGAQGPSFSVASACASGADGLGMAWLMLRAGVIDAAIAGASDALVTGVVVGSLDRSGAMSRRQGDGALAPQPFDRDRDGFVIGEGAAVLILETESLTRAPAVQISWPSWPGMQPLRMPITSQRLMKTVVARRKRCGLHWMLPVYPTMRSIILMRMGRGRC